MKKYLLYVDILGFFNLAQEISKKSGFSSEHVRQHILSEPFMRTIEGNRDEYYYSYPGTDDYLVIFNDIDSLFQKLARIICIKIDHPDYGDIPIEAAVDIIDIEENSLIEVRNKDDFIISLKSNLIVRYRDYYHNIKNESIKTTFIVSTERFYKALDFYDRQGWSQVNSHEIFIIGNQELLKLGKIYEFLAVTQLPKKYTSIDKLYVPPNEFDPIKIKLRKNKILLITGTQETGKTYTAVRLLWEYFLDGYDIKYFPAINADLSSTVSHSLSNITDHLKSHSIIYFEDPYGRIEYLPNDILERNFATILSEIKNHEDVFVIITSRTEVLKTFKLKKIGEIDFKRHEVNLNLKTSYNISQRERMLFSWGMACNCKWTKDSELTQELKNILKSENSLPTPLNIHDFCVASSRVEDLMSLKNLVIQKSKETSESFAEEFRTMENDKVLFLSFLFISDWLPVKFIKKNYEKIAKEMGITYSKFEKLVEWFEYDQDRITKSNILGHEQVVRFFHPSYSQTLKYLMGDNTVNSNFKLVFSRVLKELSLIHESKDAVDRIVAENFDLISQHERDILLNNPKGKLNLLNNKILATGNRNEIGKYTRQFIGKEGEFLFDALASASINDETKKLFLELDDWDLLFDYLTSLEKNTDLNYSTRLLQIICSIDDIIKIKQKNFTKFLKKLLSLHIDNFIKSSILESSKSEQDLVTLTKKDGLVQRIINLGFNLVSDEFIKRRIDWLLHNRFLRYDYHYAGGRYRAGTRLALTFYMEKRITNEQRVSDHIQEMEDRFKLPIEVRDRIDVINKELNKFYLSSTHEPKRIASGIVYFVCVSQGYRDLSDAMHADFGVNPTTTRKIAREIAKVIHSY